METIAVMKSALQMFMPDIADVDNWQIGYILERNKKYTIETNSELQDVLEEFKKGYQMWLDPSPVKPTASKRKSGRNVFRSICMNWAIFSFSAFAICGGEMNRTFSFINCRQRFISWECARGFEKRR